MLEMRGAAWILEDPVNDGASHVARAHVAARRAQVILVLLDQRLAVAARLMKKAQQFFACPSMHVLDAQVLEQRLAVNQREAG